MRDGRRPGVVPDLAERQRRSRLLRERHLGRRLGDPRPRRSRRGPRAIRRFGPDARGSRAGHVLERHGGIHGGGAGQRTRRCWTRSRPAGQPEQPATTHRMNVGRGGRSGGRPSPRRGEGDGDRVSAPADGPDGAAPLQPHRRPRCPTSSGAGCCGSPQRSRSRSSAFFLLSATFQFLRDEDANRGLVVLVAIVVGVVGVFALYWAMNRVVGSASRSVPRGRATVGLRWSRAGHPERLPAVPGDQHRSCSACRTLGPRVRRARQLRFRLLRRAHAAVAPQHGGVGHPRTAVRGEHRTRVRDAGRSAPSGRGRREVDDLPADGDLVRRRGRHVAA